MREWFPMPGLEGWYMLRTEGQSDDASKIVLVKDFPELTMVCFPQLNSWYPLDLFEGEGLLWSGPLPQFEQVKAG